MPEEQKAASGDQPIDTGWNALCRIGGVAAFALLAYSVALMIQLVALGGQPKTAAEAFRLLQDNKFVGLLRLDLPTVFAMPLYYFLFLGLYAALRRADRAFATLSAALGFVGVTLVLATPTALPLVALSERHALAETELIRAQLEASGEAILATDIWRGTGAIVGGILLQSAAVVVSAVMLRSDVFSRTTAYIGIVNHGLDLAHILVGLLAPSIGAVLMALAGPLYLVWFPLVGRRLLQLGRGSRCPGGARRGAPERSVYYE